MDLSSPRATLNTFFEREGEVAHLARDEFWYSPSPALSQRIADKQAELSRIVDLSGISPAARKEKSRDAFIFIFEVLSRIELPPMADIPDAAAQTSVQRALDEGAAAVIDDFARADTLDLVVASVPPELDGVDPGLLGDPDLMPPDQVAAWIRSLRP